MTIYHHLYPFSPWGVHGGTLRLRTGVEGSMLDGTAIVSWWDGTRARWETGLPTEMIGSADPEPPAALDQSMTNTLKRYVFPFTLWEAGRKPRAGLSNIVDIVPQATLVLHTSLLAPLAEGMRSSGRHVVVDVHDAMFRGHMDDALAAPWPLSAARRTYARTVRHRECRALESASALAVAGWDDTQLLLGRGLTRSTWVPVGLDAIESTMPDGDMLRVGLLGNFDHGPTARAALELVSSPLGADPEVEIVLAGNGSDRFEATRGVRALGRVSTAREFYDQVHATVVPVMNGTGMKCKLAEGALAGKAVITTRLGSIGYPPALRSGFVVVDQTSSLESSVVHQAIEKSTPAATRAQFEKVVGREAAARMYADVLAAAA